MSNSLEERLRANSSAFEGLLALIPAKYYYDEKTQDQWKAKKKSKDQVKLDKAKKLNPDEQDEGTASALEVMKRKEVDAKPVVLPGEKLKFMKKQQQQSQPKVKEPKEESDVEEEEDIKIIFDDEGNEVPVDDSEKESSPEVEVEVKTEVAVEETKKAEPKKKNLEALRAKLQARIQNMREKRKAPGSKADGAPASREAILSQRKRKDELKRKRKEQGVDNDEDDEDNSSESDLDSDNEESPNKKAKLNKATQEINADGVMFQNIVFDDGDKVTSDLQRVRKVYKKKGPSKNDISGHLKLVEAKKTKLESKDELDQIKFKEKQKWQKAMLQAEGVKLKDDEKLLRKALKRKEAKKRKSAVEWKERQQLESDNKAGKIKRREENLRIRKENKGVKRSKQQKMKRKFKPAKMMPKKRAGFEGRLKSGKKN